MVDVAGYGSGCELRSLFPQNRGAMCRDGLLGNQQASPRYHRFDTWMTATCRTDVSARHPAAEVIAAKIVPPAVVHAVSPAMSVQGLNKLASALSLQDLGSGDQPLRTASSFPGAGGPQTTKLQPSTSSDAIASRDRPTNVGLAWNGPVSCSRFDL